jgi:O-antigen/teichoic acid export membrane protein
MPILAAFASIPILINSLGVDRFGLLTLIWAVVGYFGFFDLGLGRALTVYISPKLKNPIYSDLSILIVTTLASMCALGLIAGLLIIILAPWLIGLVNGISNQQEVTNSLYALAFAMPAIVMTSGLRGVLEANHSFAIVNILRLPMGLFTFLGPLALVVFYEPRLDYISLLLSLGRVVACVAHAWFVWKMFPNNSWSLRINFSLLKPLLRIGGWMTISNLISPLMGYVDRFLVGVIVSASAVAYYVTPNELITKIWIIPGSITAVLFPKFASQLTNGNANTLVDFNRSIKLLFLLLLPITASIAIFSHELLSIWITEDFANHGANLLRIFAIGIMINSLAHVPFTLIQSIGQSRLVALVHASELPAFILLLWCLTTFYGLIGTALAWLIRMVIDSILMFHFSSKLLKQPKWYLGDIGFFLKILLFIFSFLGIFLESISLKVVWILLILAASIFLFVVNGLFLKAEVADKLD